MPLKTRELGNITRALWIVLAAVGVVLLVACANVANLFLVRTELRQREVAVRRALGRIRGSASDATSSPRASCWPSPAERSERLIAWGALQLLVQAGPNLPRLHEIRLHPIAIAYVGLVSLAIAARVRRDAVVARTVDGRAPRIRTRQYRDAASVTWRGNCSSARKWRWR